MHDLKELAEMAGISSSYVDKTGITHDTEDSSRRLFLKSMGYDVQTPADIEREILKRQQIPPLPDVLSFFDNEAIEFEIKTSGTFTLSIIDEQDQICWKNKVKGHEKINISGIKIGYYRKRIQKSG